MSYRMNGRFINETPKDAFDFITIPNCKPARVKFNQYSAEVYVVCEPIVKPAKGEVTRTQNFRATNKTALREAVEAQFPNASFTTSGNTDVTDEIATAKAALAAARQENQVVTARDIEEARRRLIRVYGQGAEITLQKCRKESISEAVFNALFRQEEQHFVGLVTQEHRKLAAEMSDTDRRNLTAANVGSFVKESAWADWFKQFNGNFFGFPDYTNKNYQTLMAYCDARGWTIPLSGELDAAMRYLLAHGHFYLQHTYPRTQRDAYRAVRPFVSIEPDVVPIDEGRQALEATKHLNAKQLKQNLQNLRGDSTKNLSPAEARQRNRIIY
jgi:hypothetical protein